MFNTQPLPLHLLYTNQKVDYLVVYDKQIFYQLTERLGWNKKKVIFKKKIKTKNNQNYKNKIFIGSGIYSIKEMIKNFEKLIKLYNLNFDVNDVKQHPVMMN